MTDNRSLDEQVKFEQLYKKHYAKLLRTASSRLKGLTSKDYDINSRAEEIVQETFCIAWLKRADYFASPSPLGWLIKALEFKIKEMNRDEINWKKRLIRFSERVSVAGDERDFRLRAEMLSIISEEEYHLLKQLYLDGFTYKELSARLGIKQSALAMRVKRIKERVSKAYKD